jgi:hypothetical protein
MEQLHPCDAFGFNTVQAMFHAPLCCQPIECANILVMSGAVEHSHWQRFQIRAETQQCLRRKLGGV